MPMKILWAGLAALFLATTAQANTPEPITLDPIEHLPAELVIQGADGTEIRYTPAELEAFDTYRLRTTTPWREVPADFDGVLLADILARSGLDTAEEIKVTAENEFQTTIPRTLWETVPVLVATRVNGRPHTRRERGPIQFVIGMEDYTTSPIASEVHLVWMAARIEAE